MVSFSLEEELRLRGHNSERSGRGSGSERGWSETPRFKDEPRTPSFNVRDTPSRYLQLQINMMFNKLTVSFKVMSLNISVMQIKLG